MPNQIGNIEDFEQIGVFSAFIQANKAIFKNFSTSISFLVPILLMTASMILISLTICELNKLISPNYILAILYFITGLPLMLYSFWQTLLSFPAATYFVKDVLENKEVQKAETYFNYAKQHTKSYIKYWLWISLFNIIIGIITAIPENIVKVSLLNGIIIPSYINFMIGMIVYIPLIIISFALTISLNYWAYNEKEKALPSIIEAIKQTFNYIPQVTLFFVLVFMAILPLFILDIIFITSAYMMGGYEPFITATLVQVPFGMFISLYTYAAFTRYYFVLIKKK